MDTHPTAEATSWNILRSYGEALNRNLVLSLAAGGRIGAFGILLPLPGPDGKGQAFQFAWDHHENRCRVRLLDGPDARNITDPLLRCNLLRRGIIHLKRAKSMIERGPVRDARVHWTKLVCPACDESLGDHVHGDGFYCPVVKNGGYNA
jgi:hypothetical protein